MNATEPAKSRILTALCKTRPDTSISEEMAEELHWVLVKAYADGIPIQSNFARANAAQVAAAASLGLITTSLLGTFGRIWRITEQGLQLASERVKQ